MIKLVYHGMFFEKTKRQKRKSGDRTGEPKRRYNVVVLKMQTADVRQISRELKSFNKLNEEQMQRRLWELGIFKN